MRIGLPPLRNVSTPVCISGSMRASRRTNRIESLHSMTTRTETNLEAAAALATRAAAGDLRALARAISLVEDGHPAAPAILAQCVEFGRKSIRIGITGPPGAGKSTLVDQLVRLLRARGDSLAVLAVDPSSPITGGALLGDRIRIHGFASDPGVYIRSMASRGNLGGLAASTAAVAQVIEGAGRNPILIETVGAGQDEIAIAALADVTLLVLVPGMGDDIQALKAGIMEVADLFVVNKADHEGASQTAAQIRSMQSLAAARSAWRPPVLETDAGTGRGVPQLLEAIDRFLAQKPEAAG